MFSNYIKITLRNLTKHKSFSFINILGLSIGITCFLIISFFIKEELSYDKGFSKGDRIYRVLRYNTGNERGPIGVTAGPYAEALLNDYPDEIEQTVRVWYTDGLVSYEDKSFHEDNLFLADPGFFKMFDIKLKIGDPETVLSKPNDVVISTKIAEKYFGDENPVGKELIIDENLNFIVTGVFEYPEFNTHINCDIVANLNIAKTFMRWFDSWASNFVITYVQLGENVSSENLISKLPSFVDKYFADQMELTGNRYNLTLEPITETYLNHETQFDRVLHGNRNVIYIFSVVAVLVLLIACINFMNLSTARSSYRMKEVGVRKTIGALKQNLIWQFIGESYLITLISLLISVIITEISLPLFNSLIGKEITVNYFESNSLLILLGILFVVGTVSGSYPAFYLSSFNPLKILKGDLAQNSKSRILRRVLVTGQFAVSIFLIAGTIFVVEQMNFVSKKDLGFVKDQVLVLPISSSSLRSNREKFKEDLLRNDDITNVTLISGEPGGFHDFYAHKVENFPGEDFTFNTVFTDFNYLNTFDLEMVAGRTLSKEYGTDSSSAVLINEKAVKELGWTLETAIGQNVQNVYTDTAYRKVVGVVKDYNFATLKSEINPLIIALGNDHRRIAVRVSGYNFDETIQFMQDAWNKYSPKYPFEYQFLDEKIQKLYEAEQKQLSLLLIFSGMAIFVACLGLFGLISFTAEQKRKEIGIRKVLGASVQGLVGLITKDFIKLVLLSNLIAWPIIYYMVQSWLSEFAYRIEIDPVVFIISGAIVLLISLLTVSVQAVKASLANPIDSIKYE